MKDAVIGIEVWETEKRHGKFVAALPDGTVLVKSTRQPLLDTARVLIAEVHDPDTRLEMRHRGSATLSMFGQIGELAKLTVRENDDGIRLVRYEPFPTEVLSPSQRSNAGASGASAGTQTAPNRKTHP
jgi:hypothetical protein